LKDPLFRRLVITLLLLYVATSGGRVYVSDTLVKLMTAESIVQRGTLTIRDFGNLTLRSPSDGKTYSQFGLLHSLFFVPASLTGKVLERAGVLAKDQRILFAGCMASLLSPLFTALGVGFFYLLAAGVTGNRRGALLAALMLGTGTMLWPYAKRSWTETPQMMFFLLAAWLLVSARGARLRRIFWAGSALGAACALRVAAGVVLPFFALFLVPPFWPGREGGSLLREAARRVSLLAAGVLAVVVPLVLVVNWVRLGSAQGLFLSRSRYFTYPFLDGLLGLLASPGESVFLYSPVILLALWFAPRLWRHDRGAFLLFAGLPATFVLIYSLWFYHGYTWGPRFLVPIVPFLMLPLAFVRPDGQTPVAKRAVFVSLVVAAIAVQLLAVAFHLGDLEELGRPLQRAGWLPADAKLTIVQTLEHPLRTRLASHFLVFIEGLSVPFGGEAPQTRLDLWVFYWNKHFGLPLAVGWIIEGCLLAGTILSARSLAREYAVVKE
jgi:hypothetical protein